MYDQSFVPTQDRTDGVSEFDRIIDSIAGAIRGVQEARQPAAAVAPPEIIAERGGQLDLLKLALIGLAIYGVYRLIS